MVVDGVVLDGGVGLLLFGFGRWLGLKFGKVGVLGGGGRGVGIGGW